MQKPIPTEICDRFSLRSGAKLSLVLLIWVIATMQTGLAFQAFVVVSNGTSTTTATTGGTGPTPGKSWDGVDSTTGGGTPSSPQIAVGPDDILTIVNRTISRYPNPNAASNGLFTIGSSSTAATESALIDTWLGIPNLNRLCPSGTSRSSCVIDNASIRYDQMHGRYDVLFTVTDLPAKTSNFVLLVSTRASPCVQVLPGAAAPACAGRGEGNAIFTTPIAPIVGGVATGGSASINWMLYTIPINLVTPSQPATVVTGSSFFSFVKSEFCSGGGGGTAPCTNYYPTGARMGIDNDNIILTAPVLDLSKATTGTVGPYAGTRVVTIPKLQVYNFAPNATVVGPQPQGSNCAGSGCGAVNLSDNSNTGTLTGPTGTGTSIPPIFWEPSNLRGRPLASFDAQVNVTPAAGAISPIDYLVGTFITNDFGTGLLSSNMFYLQAIVFSCPSSTTLPQLGTCVSKSGTAIPTLPNLAPRVGLAYGPLTGDTGLVAQSNANDGTSMLNKRLYVGDSRPEQVILREGLLYVARNVRLGDSSSTVAYDVLKTGVPGAFTPTGGTLPNSSPLYNWYLGPGSSLGYGFFSPMFDVPADVSRSAPTSPVFLSTMIDHLKVGTTVTGNNHPGLYDFHAGEDAYDTPEPFLNPYSGVITTAITNTGGTGTSPIIPWSVRGGASTDPNDGSLWLFGEFAKNRLATASSPGQWGTSVANYSLAFPASDLSGSGNSYFTDVPPSSPNFTWIQIAKNNGITPPGIGGCGGSLICPAFQPDAYITRSEMARWVVRAQMDDTQVSRYLMATGGIPGCSDVTPAQGNYVGSCINPGVSSAASFHDGPAGCSGGSTGCNYPGYLNDPYMRYIEVMARRGYTKGCVISPQPLFCGGDPITTGQAAEFLVKAKLNNVFPTTLNGTPLSFPTVRGTSGDAFELFFADGFADEPGNFLIYISKLRELGITGGGPVDANAPLQRKQVAEFVVRAFFL